MDPSGKKNAGSRAPKKKGRLRPAARAKNTRSGFDELIVQISTRFIALPAESVSSEIIRAQQDVCECLGLDISSLWQLTPDNLSDLLSTHIYVPPDYDVPLLEMAAQDYFPWSMTKLIKGETVVLSRMTDIPPQGARDLEIFRYYRIQSSICFPLAVGGGPIFGAVAFDSIRKPTTWTPEIIDQLGLVAQVFANALFRKRAEQELRESEAHYRGLYEDSLEGIFRTSPEGKVLFVNPAMARIIGYDSPDDVARSITDLASQIWVVPEERLRFIQRIEEEGSIRAYECRLRRKDGTPIWVSLNVRPVRGPDGRIVHFDGFAENIDERRRAEISLAENEKRYRSLFENTPVGISVVTPDGYVRTANSLQARLYGYESPQLLEGFFAPAFLAERDRERAAELITALAKGDALTGRIYTAVRRDGSEFAVEVTAIALRGPDRDVQEFLILTRDITKSQQDEEERAQLRLERTHLARVLAVDEISTTLAHEINQPLGAILNNAEAARILLAQGAGKARGVPEIVEDIIQDAKRAGDIIRKVRRVIKKSESRFERLPVNSLIDEILEFLHNNLALNNVTLRRGLAPDLADVAGDRVHLQQVLLNLVTNALDAMKDVPSRILTVRSAMEGPERVTVSVGDSGPGFDEAHRESLFQPFFTTKPGGLGLGLSICRSIIEEHGGRIWANSEPGGGATFSFSLNAWRENAG
jgi:PAS domain S-box-containing protein